MKIKNTSKIYDNELVRKVIDFVRPPNVRNFDVMLKNSQYGIRGRCYTQGCAYHSTASPFIVACISPRVKYPYKFIGGKGYISHTVYNSTEGLVSLLAHELRHLWQAKVKKGWRVWGAKGQFSERDADAYAIHKVREWRRI